MIRYLIILALIITIVSSLWSSSETGRMDSCLRRHDDFAYCETAVD